MPVTIKRVPTDDQQADGDGEDGKPESFTRFVYRPHWLVLAQTEGQAVEPVRIPEWDQARALDALGVVHAD